MNTIPSQRINSGNRSRLYFFCKSLIFQIRQLSLSNLLLCMLVLECLSSVSRNEATCRKNPRY
jgi:hypothetical protein